MNPTAVSCLARVKVTVLNGSVCTLAGPVGYVVTDVVRPSHGIGCSFTYSLEVTPWPA
jgi:hypothetical protein